MDVGCIEVRQEVPAGSFDYDRWLTNTEVKLHINIETDDEDDLLDTYIQSAVQYIQGVTGLNLANHTKYYVYSTRVNANYLFNGRGIDKANVEARKHEKFEGFHDFSNQDVVTHSYNDHVGSIKSIFIKEVNTAYLTVKVPIVWIPAEHPMIKTVLMTIVCDMYRNREMSTFNNLSVNKVLSSQLKRLRVV